MTELISLNSDSATNRLILLHGWGADAHDLMPIGKLLTDGGRVLSIVCQDKDFDMVFERAYKNLKEIKFDGIYFRNDIGHQVRKKLSTEN